ncbi:MAG: DUF1521 domain-containing protein [Hyalangium sp.]|uniref:DUF1521 domain-containing protein n=1 Tax=Hyalangium sp. TaxID=2028555 RepID=UPI003899C5AD
MNATTKTTLGQTPKTLQSWGAGLKDGLNAAEKQLVKAAVSTLTAAVKVATAELELLSKAQGQGQGKSIDDVLKNAGSGCPSTPAPADSTHPAGSLKADKDGVITTPGGYKIQATDKFNWKITGPDGKETNIWGDPHVKESDGGEWQFKDNSTFVLGDGTRINVNTTPYGNGATVTGSLDIMAGNDHVKVTDIDKGKGKVGDITHDGFQHVNDFNGKDVFVMGKDSDDWSFMNREITGSQDQGAKLTLGDSMAAGSPNNSNNVTTGGTTGGTTGHLSADDKGVITTPGGYKIEATEKFNWKITGPDGKSTEVWGDPHVKESDGGEWQFKKNSTMVLPDGTRINISCKPYGNGATVTGDLDIIAGNERVQINGIDQGKGRVSDLTHDGYNYMNQNEGRDVFVMGKDTDDWTFHGKEVTGSENQGETIKTGNDMAAGTTPSTTPSTSPSTKPTTNLKDLTTKLQQMVDMFRSLAQVFSSLKNLENVLGKRSQQNPGIVPPGRQPATERRQHVLERSFAQIGRMMDTLLRFQNLSKSINTNRNHMFQG